MFLPSPSPSGCIIFQLNRFLMWFFCTAGRLPLPTVFASPLSPKKRALYSPSAGKGKHKHAAAPADAISADSSFSESDSDEYPGTDDSTRIARWRERQLRWQPTRFEDRFVYDWADERDDMDVGKALTGVPVWMPLAVLAPTRVVKKVKRRIRPNRAPSLASTQSHNSDLDSNPSTRSGLSSHSTVETGAKRSTLTKRTALKTRRRKFTKRNTSLELEQLLDLEPVQVCYRLWMGQGA